MARRYSDINRGPLLAQAHTRRQAYLARDISERNANSRIGQRQASPTLFVLIKPFGQTLTGANDAYRGRTNQRNRAQLRDEIDTHAADIGQDATFLVSGNFNPAVIKLFVKTSSTTTTSRVTGLRYLKANGQNYSHPFGAAAATDKEYQVFNTIASALRNASVANKVSYTPEKFSEER